jgi:integrase
VLVTGKGNKQARQALAERELTAVLRWVEVRRVLEPACDRLFVRVGVGGQLTAPDRPLIERTVYEICDETAKRCGIAPFAPHDLRRTFATRLYRAGWSDTAVQKMMRHADVRTTQRYDKREQEEIDALRMAVDMWPGAKPAELFTEKTEQKKEEG